MPKLTLTFPHSYSRDEVIVRLRRFADTLKERYPEYFSDLHESWENGRARIEGTVMGFSATGEIEADEREARLSLSYPFVALPFRGKIEAVIREAAEEILA
jgi:hypothetical protein